MKLFSLFVEDKNKKTEVYRSKIKPAESKKKYGVHLKKWQVDLYLNTDGWIGVRCVGEHCL